MTRVLYEDLSGYSDMTAVSTANWKVDRQISVPSCITRACLFLGSWWFVSKQRPGPLRLVSRPICPHGDRPLYG